MSKKTNQKPKLSLFLLEKCPACKIFLKEHWSDTVIRLIEHNIPYEVYLYPVVEDLVIEEITVEDLFPRITYENELVFPGEYSPKAYKSFINRLTSPIELESLTLTLPSKQTPKSSFDLPVDISDLGGSIIPQAATKVNPSL